jgi:hypothetical protein
MPKQPASRASRATRRAAEDIAQVPPAPAAAPRADQAAPALAAAAPAYDPRGDIEAMRRDLMQLQLCVKQIAEVNAIENVLCRGFAEMREGLDLLRQSNSGRVGLREEVGLRLNNLRSRLEGPSWSGATTLPVHNLPVKFIGEVEIAPPDDGRPRPFYAQPSRTEAERDYLSRRDQYGSAQS